jgi:hypothetical protein
MSAATKQQAVNDVIRMAQSMRGIMELADELKAIGSLEQAADEAKKRLDKLVAEEAKWKSQAQTIIDNATNQAAARKVADDADATLIKKQIAELVAQAHADADKIVNDGRAKANDLWTVAQSGVEALKREKEGLLTEIGKAKATSAQQTNELSALSVAVAEAKTLRDEVIKHIADLKAKFS